MKEQQSYSNKRKRAIIILIVLLVILAFLGSFFFVKGKLDARAAEQASSTGLNEEENTQTNTSTSQIKDDIEQPSIPTVNQGNTTVNTGINTSSINTEVENNTNNAANGSNEPITPTIPDTTAPEVTGVVEGGVYARNVVVTINAYDLNDALCKFEAVDGTVTETAFTSNTQFTRDGKYKLTVTDLTGNKTVRTFYIDKTLPVLTVKDNSVGTDPYYSNISFSLFDNNQIVKYVINGTEVACSPSKWGDANYVNIKDKLVEGENTITLFDIAGNEATKTFTYDKTAPVAQVEYSNDNGEKWTNQDVTVTLTLDEYVKDIENWTRVDDTKFTKVFEANETSAIVVEDRAGNQTTVNYEVRRIDKEAPVIDLSNTSSTFEVGVDVYSYPERITVTDNTDTTATVSRLNIQWFKANANGSKGDPVPSFEWGTSLVNRELGDYYIRYYIKDKAGNLAETHRILKLQDTTAPIITLNGDEEVDVELNGTYTGQYFRATDNYSATENIVKDTKSITYNNLVDDIELPTNSVDTSKEGRYTITYRAIDEQGNTAEKSRTVYVNDSTVLNVEGIDYDTSVTGQVTVKITANKKIKPVTGWTLLADGKSVSKVYTENTEYVGENITISDLRDRTTAANVKVNTITNSTGNLVLNVGTTAGLVQLAEDMTNGTSFANDIINITNDIDLSNETWEPIYAGSGNRIFNNTVINGNGNKITGMTMSREPATTNGSSQKQYGIGFIGDVSGSLTIKDLKFENVTVTDAYGGTGSNYSQHYAGVVVGHSDSTLTLENITVTNANIKNSWQCGGLVGYSSGNVTFKNCSISDSFVGGYNATAGTLFGLGIVDVNVENCTSNNVRLYTDGLTWSSTQKIKGNYWVGHLYGRTLTVNNSTETNVTVVDQY